LRRHRFQVFATDHMLSSAASDVRAPALTRTCNAHPRKSRLCRLIRDIIPANPQRPILQQ
jgi:hypothetical protein